MHRAPDDPELLPHRGASDLGPLFGPSFPTRPAAVVEQETLPIDGTIQGEYTQWRRTQLGEFTVETMRVRALDLVRRGAERIGAKALAEHAREQKISIDNRFVALIARELLSREPELRGRIECRQRTAT